MNSHREDAEMENKDNKIINIILTCAILFLSISIVVFLIARQPWKRNSSQTPGSLSEDAASVESNADAMGSPVEEALPPIETSLIDFGDFVTFVPYAFTDDSGGSSDPELTYNSSGTLRTTLANFITARPTGAKTDPEAAFQIYKAAADSGNAEAQYVVYAFEYAGIGGAPSDPNEMMTYLSTSAENGYAPAQNEIGLCYVMNDYYADAAAWFEKAAEQGLITAKNNLGIMYYSGYGVPIDYQKAYDLFLPCAEQGIVQAQFSLGTMFEDGYGVERDKQKAFDYYMQSASAGYAPAQTYVGDSYLHGAGVAADPKEAFRWYSLAAEQGDFSAQFWLGYMYENGIGVEKNDQFAAMWYGKSAEKTRAVKESVSNDDQTADNQAKKSLLSAEEQLHLYRQFLLRGDLMKKFNYNHEPSLLRCNQLRYRIYDIDSDGINELFLVTPINADCKVVFGMLWLDNNNQVNQTLYTCSKDSTAMIGTINMNGKWLEAEYYDNSYGKWWILRDLYNYKDSLFEAYINGFGYEYDGEYEVVHANIYQVSEEEFPWFYQQVDIIIGTGLNFDSFIGTISYDELMGNEISDPELKEYEVDIDWGKDADLSSSQAVNVNYDGALHTLTFADDMVIHRFVSDGEPLCGFYVETPFNYSELIEEYNATGRAAYFLGEVADWENPERHFLVIGGRYAHMIVQIKDGEIKAMWIQGP